MRAGFLSEILGHECWQITLFLFSNNTISIDKDIAVSDFNGSDSLLVQKYILKGSDIGVRHSGSLGFGICQLYGYSI
jgi:hypothetical protein